MAEDTGAAQRQTERFVFDRAIVLMRKAQTTGPQSREWVDATFYVNRLWTTLMEDLGHPDNGLPTELKASLVSIGIWVLRKVEELRQGQAWDFTPVIDISETIRKGLERN